jgi:8-amino-7-oxononanoate synthase
MADPDFIRETLSRLKAKGLYRRLAALGSAAGPHVQVGRRSVLQFASNNYLGLANDPRVKQAARAGIDRWGWGAGASRLVSGHTEAHAALEADLAAFKHTEAALVFPTGYMTNLAVVTALAGPGDTVVMDRANHASLYDAVVLAGSTLVRYPQCDAEAAARLLDKYRGGEGRRLLVTDTVFSMDGRTAPLPELADLCRRAGAMLVLDEAHATGVLGPTGAGLAEELAVTEGITASVGTLSKALGGIGGFVAASRQVCALLVNRARPFIYTTALPAAACEAARAALQIVRTEPERRRRLLDLAKRLRTRLQEAGFDLAVKDPPVSTSTPIIPIILGDPETALGLAAALLEKGIFCPAIRPPTVPAGASRLRVSLTAEHTEEDLERLVSVLVRIRC